MRLYVIVPHYNRQDLLPLALNSLFAAEVPAGVQVTVTVVDNNSTDGTRDVIESFREKYGERIQYVFEQQQGRSHALNARHCGHERRLSSALSTTTKRSIRLGTKPPSQHSPMEVWISSVVHTCRAGARRSLSGCRASTAASSAGSTAETKPSLSIAAIPAF